MICITWPRAAFFASFVVVLALVNAPVARGFGLPSLGVHSNHPVVVGYFPLWGIFDTQRPYYVKTLVTNGSARRLDQINYSQGAVGGGKCSLADPNADLNTAFTVETSVSSETDDPQFGVPRLFPPIAGIEEPLSPDESADLGARRQGERFRGGRQAREPAGICCFMRRHFHSRAFCAGGKQSGRFRRVRRRHKGIAASPRRTQRTSERCWRSFAVK